MVASLSDIADLAARGESETAELKKTTSQRSEAARSLSAMLNGAGTAVLFGVADDGSVVGQPTERSSVEVTMPSDSSFLKMDPARGLMIPTRVIRISLAAEERRRQPEVEKDNTPGAYRPKTAGAGPGCTSSAYIRCSARQSRRIEPMIHSDVIKFTSRARLNSYMQATNNVQSAIDLYLWNVSVSAAFMELLHHVEVVVRNAMHNQLSAGYEKRAGRWFDDQKMLRSSESESIQTAYRRLGGHPGQGRIVAELSFGTWNALVGRAYQESLWIPYLHKAFPHGNGSRQQVAKALTDMRRFRNRIAHHEPIHNRDLHADHNSIMDVLGWISGPIREWIEPTSRVPELLRTRPSTDAAP